MACVAQNCDCHNVGLVADSETHYFITAFDQTNQSNGDPYGVIWVDDPTRGTLNTRTAMELYNDGSVDWQYTSNNSGFAYGQGRTVKPNTGVALAVGPGIRHYIQCSATGCSIHVTELGIRS